MTALQHLLSLKSLDRAALTAILDRAQGFSTAPGRPPLRSHLLQNHTVANLFFEPSTRTRASFELAARRLGADVLNLDVARSSTVKGETVLDTFCTLQAMHVDYFVVRHQDAGVPALLAQHAQAGVHVVNAGEAHLTHPTQGLLDALTIRQHKPDFSRLAVVIAGDLQHSRVARSAVQALDTLGVRDLRLVAPPQWAAADLTGQAFTDFDQALDGADVVMMLRIQKERMQGEAAPDENDYLAHYQLNSARLRRAKPDALVMHPGPMNRGVEITSEVADGTQSVIREQVANGVAVRMAVLAGLHEATH